MLQQLIVMNLCNRIGGDDLDSSDGGELPLVTIKMIMMVMMMIMIMFMVIIMMTNPAPRPSGFGESRRRRTRSDLKKNHISKPR